VLNIAKRIIELDANLINKIAAGEVIERPASIVKELIENSLDAGAKSILIEVNEGGKSFIKVTDDGHGIAKDQLIVAVKRHSTSKIDKVEDLFDIRTLGFRGEALASIGSVSYMKIVSRMEDEDVGTVIEVEGGDVRNPKDAAANKGTSIEVHNLFFNVPARKKHLKSMYAEFKHIMNVIVRYALINSDIHFKLIHNDQLVLNVPSTADALANVAAVYGNNIAKKMLAIDFNFFDIDVKGFVGKPELTRADKNYQSIYVNGRYIRNSMITRAVYDGYGTLLFHGRHPVFILDMKINPAKIDVNVHPTKSEIRIEKEDNVYSTIRNAVMAVFKDERLMPDVERIKAKAVETRLSMSEDQDYRRQALLADSVGVGISGKEGFEEDELNKTKDGKLNIRLVGKIHNTYIIAEDKEGMILIDQHAAHERVMYEKFMKQYHDKDIKLQKLIEPIMLELSPTDSLVVKNNLDVFLQLGIEMEEFGKDTFIVRSLPAVLSKQQDKRIIMDMIDELNSGELSKFSKIKEEQIAIASCRAAVKAHDVLEMPQVYRILQDLFKCENPNTCPHGRPVMIRFPLYEIEKKFSRK